jgi:molybdopterin molybdotransferase
MIPLEQARDLVLAGCPILEPVWLRTSQAAGLVIAEVVTATEFSPPWDNSAVDGYAVRAEDFAGGIPVELEVIGEVAAGGWSEQVIGPGQTIRIMTGAPMPGGADAVVMVEDSELLQSNEGMTPMVRLHAQVALGQAVRRIGEDMQPGDRLFEPGTVISPAVTGVLAASNTSQVKVWPRATVAVLSTGDELVDGGAELRPGQIRESNRPMLVRVLEQAGCEVEDLGIIPDDEEMLEQVLRSAAQRFSAIVTSGGVSMGDYDVVKAVLGRIAEMQWMQIAIKPAKPFAFGHLGGVPIFGLPGNPVSSLVSCEMLARPALRQMMGHRDVVTADSTRPRVRAIAVEPLERKPDGKVHLMRVNAVWGSDGQCRVAPVKAQGSHQLAATALANGIAIVPDGEGIAVGGAVEVVLLLG